MDRRGPACKRGPGQGNAGMVDLAAQLWNFLNTQDGLGGGGDLPTCILMGAEGSSRDAAVLPGRCLSADGD